MRPSGTPLEPLYSPHDTSDRRHPSQGMTRPRLFLKRHEDRRLRSGHLWVFSNEIDTARSGLTALQPGEVLLRFYYAQKCCINGI